MFNSNEQAANRERQLAAVKKRPNEADAWWLVFDDFFDAFFKTLGIQTKL